MNNAFEEYINNEHFKRNKKTALETLEKQERILKEYIEEGNKWNALCHSAPPQQKASFMKKTAEFLLKSQLGFEAYFGCLVTCGIADFISMPTVLKKKFYYDEKIENIAKGCRNNETN